MMVSFKRIMIGAMNEDNSTKLDEIEAENPIESGITMMQAATTTLLALRAFSIIACLIFFCYIIARFL